MAVNLSPFGGVGVQFFDNSGDPLTGGKIFTYAAGTTTPQTTYTTSAGNIAHSNPIILDAGGRVPNGGEIWLTDGLQYKFLLKDANDVQIASYDNVIGINSNFVAFTNSQEIVVATAGQTVFNLGINYQPGTNSLTVFVDGVNQYGPGAQYAYVETDENTVTFTNGLHVGAEVKFTTSQLNTSGAVDAEQVSYNPPFTGGVATNVEAKLSEYVSVKDFGAVGDGVVDDTAAIQAALDAASLIYMPPGTYKTTANLSLNNGNSLIGVPGETIIAPTNYGGGYNIEIFNITTGAKVYGITLDANFYAYNVNVYNSANVTIENCTFSNGGQDCIYIGESSNLVIRNCRINDATRNGISVISGTNIIIDGCWIVGTDTAHTGGSPWSGIDVEPDPGTNVDGIVISNCRIYDWAGHGCAFAGINASTQYVRNARFIGNYVENAGFDCVAALGAGCEVTIDGNTFRTGSRAFFSNNVGTTPARAIFSNNIIRPKTGVTTATGIRCQVDTQLTATGNAIYGMAEPIYLASCISGCTFTGNLISDCTSLFIVFSSSNINIVGNQFKSSYGIDIITSDGVLVNGNKFSDMIAAATSCVAVRVTSNKISVVGNEFSGTGVGLTKFVAQSASTNVHVSENMGVVLGGIAQFLQTGTWTPTYQTSNNDIGTVTYDAVTSGAWSRVGNIVTVTGTIRTDGITSVGTGELQIHGLPYNVASSATDAYVGSIAMAYSFDFAGDAPLGGYIPENNTYIALTYKTSVNGSSIVSQAADLDTGTNKNLVTFSATYITADDV